MQEQPLADKVAVAVGTGASALIGLETLNTLAALTLAVASLVLVGYRIAIARREWREGKRSTD